MGHQSSVPIFMKRDKNIFFFHVYITKRKLDPLHVILLHAPYLFPQCSLFFLQKKYRDFRLQGVLDSTLNSKMYETVRNRLILEEATASVREGGMQGISMKDSDEEDD